VSSNLTLSAIQDTRGLLRLSDAQTRMILESARDLFGEDVRVTLFGSRADDSSRGGDVDLLVEVSGPVDHPAVMMARLSARISRGLHGRKVDVVISASNLADQAIHRVARESGVRL
jgi:predicted nucleotidyltransferase